MTQMNLNLYQTRETSFLSNKERKEEKRDVHEGNLILKILREFKEIRLTASEITSLVNTHYNKNYPRNDVARALTRLRNKGLVEENGTKICPITNRCVIAWRTT